MSDLYVASSYGFSPCSNIVEIVGSYRRNRYDSRRLVVITSETVSEEDKCFDFDSSFDVPINNKIEINSEEYIIINKTYQLNGDIDYIVEDKFIKSENYDEQYEEIKKEAANYLLKKRELEEKLETKEAKESKKKSIWRYFGIR